MQVNVERYNPIEGGHFRAGQAEAITSMVNNFEKGIIEQTLKAPTAAGKCLGKDTSIIMFDGTTKKVQDINPGDLLMGPDSQSRRVISTTQGFGQLYKIVPTWGKSFICNDAHILNLKNTYRETKSDNYKGFYQIGETLNISISEYIKTSNNFKHHMKLWHAAIKFPEIPIQWSPYIIGVWIGDGDFNTLSITNPDIEIYDEFERYASELGLEFREYFNEGCGNARRFGIKNHADLGNPEVVKNANTLYRFVMNNCRVNGEKRLPASYMINSESIRLQLLAGLIDSDGWNSGTYYEFTTKYEGLAKDVAFLASSLGFESRATQIQSRHQSWEPNRTSTYHVITICGEVSRIPCKVERKKSTYVHKQRIPLTSSFKVVDAGNDNYYGFMLEGDGLFLLGDFTVTHNTLDLVAFGNILKDEFGVKKVLFTSPQVALVETGNLFGLPKLVGKANYPCPGLQGCTAEDCLFPGNTPKLWSACDDCPYNKAKAAFRAVDFGATTFARYLVDPMIRRETAALLIDESSNLFDSLIDSSSIEIPEKVFGASQESSLHEALHAWWSQLLKDIAAKESRLKLLRADLKDMKSPDKKLLDEAKKVQKECSSLTRKADAANKAMGYIKKEVPYIVTSEEEFRYIKGRRGQKVKTLVHTFRLLDAKIPYYELVTGLQCVILASGTPTTSLLTTDPKHAYVTIQHPIDPGRRTVTYKPIGSMNYTERYNTAPKMAQEIIQLHNQYHRNTLVHCGNYEIAKLLMDGIDGKASVLLQDRNERKDNFNSWFKGDDTIFLSVNFEQGMDCKGEKFPMNIIAKIPFPNLGSQWVKARNNLDSWQWYNMQTALMVMQACGRTTRTPQDYSETYICDTSFAGFYNRNKGLFFDWFQAALRGF